MGEFSPRRTGVGAARAMLLTVLKNVFSLEEDDPSRNSFLGIPFGNSSQEDTIDAMLRGDVACPSVESFSASMQSSAEIPRREVILALKGLWRTMPLFLAPTTTLWRWVLAAAVAPTCACRRSTRLSFVAFPSSHCCPAGQRSS